MTRKVLSVFLTLSMLFTLLSSLAPHPTLADEATIVLDGQRDAGYVRIASDPQGDLGGPGDWVGTHWTDLTDLYVAADATHLYVYATLYAYTTTVSSGKIGLAMDVDAAPYVGGSADPWDTAVTFAYDTVDGATAPAVMKPDYVIRGDVPNDGGWTELRTWDGNDWDTGSGVNWGGISGGEVGTNIAYSQGQGVEFAIPLSDIGDPDPANVHLQVFANQGGGSKGAYDTVPSDEQSAGWDDPTTQHHLVSVPLAVDPAGDLAMTWVGIDWTDMTAMHIWADHAALHLFIPMPDYDPAISDGQLGLAIDTQDGGGSGDPWGNAITFAYTTTWQNLGYTPVVITQTLLPDYLVRGNIFSNSGDGWTELRAWDGSDWGGGGTDWGGIGNSGQGSLPGSKVAWTDGEGLRLTIPFGDIGVAAGDTLHLEFFGTQGGGVKGAYDTVPTDDQSTGWDDPTTQHVLASYTIPDVPRPRASHDDDIWWEDLGHNSRDPLYRTPTGAVITDTSVKLRLRAAAGDLTAAQVRIWDDRLNVATVLDMQLVADDGTYEWWEITVPVGADPTSHWYRFIAIDGTAVAYYEDDAQRTGGWGKTFAESQDYSWQLTVYNPAFSAPDWVKNAVIYQVFPERFRDGDPDNHPPPGSFHYDLPDGTIYRSTGTDWNTPICDPRDANGPCPGKWGENFYGGDLQGLLDKLDYLEDLGVTAIYLNPVFESPSNHKYDTTDFSVIDDNFGDLSTFISVTTEAANRGIHVILDGVFNHTSSDSIYFDRYGRYDSVGACESTTSPYRDWYYFEPADPPGTGPCVGDDGTPGGADYESWWGYDSLPKLKANSPAVRDLIWDDGTNSIGPYWVQWGDGWRLDVAADVDPGVTNDPTNDYWEGFRAAVRAENPDTYIVGEEWGNSTPWLLAPEWDASMNYQFGTAIMGFWRDELFVDNDHNSSSSAGELRPIGPSELDARLHYLEERYPPEAFYTMMNLLDSHDTNRALFMMDHNADQNDPSLYEDPTYDWSDAMLRLKGVALLQLTLPGAPTIYYGDEVGLVAPPAYAGGQWEDDPYNRIPFPWLDESGTPYYTHLQSQAGQDMLRDYYKLLIDTRLQHPALRTGSFDTLLTDDDANVYVYGRKLTDAPADAAVIFVNRDTVTQTVAVPVEGYLGEGARFTDTLGGGAVYTVTSGMLEVADVPPMGGAILVLESGDITPPAPPAIQVESGNGEVVVSWTPGLLAAGDVTVYRSLVSGGGFDPIAVGISSDVYTDTDVTNGVRYYYAATERDAAGNESALSTEASALPFAPIGWAGNLEPTAITHTIGITPTGPISAQVWIDGVTNAPGQGENVWAQIGWGITGTLTDTWTWAPMSYVGDVGNNDQYALALTPEMTGTFQYLARFSSNLGETWTYAYTGGGQKGTLLVEAATDTTPPATPTNLTVIDWSADDIVLQWDPVADPDLYAYDIFRYGAGQTAMDAVAVGRALAPSTVFTDDTVTTGETYTYTVRALDDAFNASGFSNPATGVAEPKLVDVVFEVTVPDYTPDAATIYIVGDNEMAFGAMWDPSAQPMHHLGGDTWIYTATVGDGTALQYKYTRGDWDRVENWGTLVGTANRQLTVDYGTDGTMMVQNQVYNWRDPLVVDHIPATDAISWGASSPISVTFSRMLDTGNIDDSVFVLEEQGGDIITGTFGFDPWVEVFGDPVFGTVHVTGTVVLVTPTVMLQTDQGYQVTLVKEGYVDDVAMRTDYAWTFGATAPSLHLDKSVALTREPAYPGDPITYTLVLSNSGLADAAGVVVTDTLPTGVIGLDVDETITVAAGTHELLTIHALVDVGTWGETITNTAFYAHSTGAGSDAAAFTVLGETTVALTKTVEPGMALDWGDTVTYTLQVHNTGSAIAADVLITDTIPMSVTFGGFVMDNGAMLLGDTVVWAGDLASDALATVVFTATVNADVALYGTTVTNQAALTAFNVPTTEDQASFTVKQAPALTVVKTAAPTSDLYPGDTVTYTIVLTNTGEALAQGIMLTDTLPAQLAFDAWIVQPMAATVQGRTIRWQGELDGADSLTFVFRASVHEETSFVPLTLVNTVVFSSDNGGDGSDDVEIQVTPPALMIHKAVTPTQDIALGGVVRYTVQVSNSEMTPASGVVVTDVLPTGVTFGGWVTRPAEGLIWSSWVITWTGTLDYGAPLTLVFTATLGTDEAFYDQTFTNVAYVTSANAGSGTAEASFTVETGARYLYLPIMLRQYPDVVCVQCGDR